MEDCLHLYSVVTRREDSNLQKHLTRMHKRNPKTRTLPFILANETELSLRAIPVQCVTIGKG